MTPPCDESPKPTCRTCFNWWPNFYRDTFSFTKQELEEENPCLGLKTAGALSLEYTEPDDTCEGWEKI